MKKIMGVDIGGTKIAIGLLNEENKLDYQLELASDTTDANTMYRVVQNGIKACLIDNHLMEKDVVLGIGVPGIIDVENGIAIYQNNLPWKNFPIISQLKKDFPKITQITMENDVTCAAIAEWKALKLAATDSMVFLTVSTGIASPVIIGGVPVKGMGTSGEIGLLPVKCPFKQQVERLEWAASGTAISEFAKISYGIEMDGEEIFKCYHGRDEKAVEIIESVVVSLSHAIYSISCLIDPTKIVLGGSVIMKNPFLISLIKAQLAKEIIPVQQHILSALTLSKYDNNASLVGACLISQ